MAAFTDLIDLASERLGGAVLIANDEFFAPKEALVKQTAPEWREGAFTERGKWMDGWETRRRRSPGHDWAIVRLGAPGIVRGVVVDTTYFTGNYPERASIDAAHVDGTPSAEWLAGSEVQWEPLLIESQLKGNTTNEFAIDGKRRVTHLRLNIFPDGGVARLRAFGNITPEGRLQAGLRLLNTAAQGEAEAALCACCGAARWVEQMLEKRPFRSLDHLRRAADETWWSLDSSHWLEAFRAHPRIGERGSETQSATARQWSAQEQSGARGSADATPSKAC